MKAQRIVFERLVSTGYLACCVPDLTTTRSPACRAGIRRKRKIVS